jgi:hypothetical protein
MAYGSSYTPPPTSPTSPVGGRGDSGVQADSTPTGKPEENPQDNISEAPTSAVRNLEGSIKFQRPIFSQTAFRQRVNVNFSELVNERETVDLDSFFDQYRRLFYDIPKQGEFSHERLIIDSTDYFRNFIDPKDQEIQNLSARIQELSLENQDLQQQLAIQEVETEVEEILDQNAALESLGNLSNPFFYWEETQYVRGISFAIQQLSAYDGLPNGYEFKTSNKDKIVRDFNDAFERGGPSGDRARSPRRTYTEWVTDYKRRSSGNRQDDGVAILDYWKDNLTTAQFFWNTGYYANA